VETPMVGREVELARLSRALEDAWAGRGHAVAVLGEAGIGKSRLVAELGGQAARRGGRLLVGRSYESEQILPLGLWVEAFRTGRVVTPQTLDGLGAAWRAELARLFRSWQTPEPSGARRPTRDGSSRRSPSWSDT
jgi:predicted ATPase